jgi:hypothetical protein
LEPRASFLRGFLSFNLSVFSLELFFYDARVSRTVFHHYTTPDDRSCCTSSISWAAASAANGSASALCCFGRLFLLLFFPVSLNSIKGGVHCVSVGREPDRHTNVSCLW